MEIEWGKWECPDCETEHDDPENITITTCGNCNITVLLSPIDSDGKREAFKQIEYRYIATPTPIGNEEE